MGSLQRDPEEVKELIERIDPNNNGLISFNEFINLMQAVENRIVSKDDQNYDANNNQ